MRGALAGGEKREKNVGSPPLDLPWAGFTIRRVSRPARGTECLDYTKTLDMKTWSYTGTKRKTTNHTNKREQKCGVLMKSS
jgi:hypothetical protein